MVMAAQRQAVAAKAQALGDLDQEALEAKRKKLAEIKPIPGRLTVKLVGGRCVPARLAVTCVVQRAVACGTVVTRSLPWVIGRGLQRHDRGSKAAKTKINPYFKFELGGQKSIKKRSTPIKNSNATPDFKGEVRTPGKRTVGGICPSRITALLCCAPASGNYVRHGATQEFVGQRRAEACIRSVERQHVLGRHHRQGCHLREGVLRKSRDEAVRP